MPRTQPFDTHYSQYEDWFTENRYVYESELHAVKHFIPPEGEGVEIGVGQVHEKHKSGNAFYRFATFFSTAEVIGILEKNNVKKPEIVQTVFGNLPDIKEVQDFKKGYGEGGFVVIRADKGMGGRRPAQ